MFEKTFKGNQTWRGAVADQELVARGAVSVRRHKHGLRINRLGEGDMTPLDVMLAAMRDAVTRGDMAAAAGFAKDAAPYVHPRLQAVLHTPGDVPGDNTLARVMDEISNRTRGRLPSDFLPVIQPRQTRQGP